MESSGPVFVGAVLPRLLALPAGTIAGVFPVPEGAWPSLQAELSRFGPSCSTEPDLRHAALHPPPRVGVHADRIASPILAAALASLRQAGCIVVIRSADPGRLLEWCDRVLSPAGDGVAWVAPAAMRARRRLELRVEGRSVGPGGAWIHVPLDGRDGAEAVMAAFAATGVRVCESRIAYETRAVR
jgi:hypothetical protein